MVTLEQPESYTVYFLKIIRQSPALQETAEIRIQGGQDRYNKIKERDGEDECWKEGKNI